MIPYEVWTPESDAFPESLRGIPQCPKQLYAVGDRVTLDAVCVAVVGTRRPTAYGERVTAELARTLASAGVCIVSGLAYGVDACAHRATLAAGGRTVAVLGTGIDQVYPAGHRALYTQIARRGLVLSEQGPGVTAFRGCFPRRNRIIAGLCAVTFVVEAGHKSGALITADYAQDIQRTVAAVPGPIESDQSHGTNRLIRDGAQVITCMDDALALIGLTGATKPAAPALSGDEAVLWDVLAQPGLRVDDVVTRTGWPPNRCLVAITNLEVNGLVQCLFGGEIRKLV